MTLPSPEDRGEGRLQVPVPSTEPVAWGLVGLPAVAQLVLHLATAGRFGIFRDEYYYLACAARPDWGYVDHPSLSIWLLAAWTAVFGDSVLALRVPAALCGAGLVVLAGVTAARLGGRRWAQLAAALGVAVGGGNLAISGFYSMNALDLPFWLGAYLLVIRAARTDDPRSWLGFGLVVGLGLLNKIGLLVLGPALAVGLVATRLRRHLADWRLYAGGALALALASPYALWNAAHGWPTREFVRSAQSGKIAAFTPLEFLLENALMANPLTLPVWAGGLGWLLLARSGRRYRVVAITVAATFALLVMQSSKPYYFASSIPVLMAAGGVAWERWTARPRLGWLRVALVAVLLAGGAVIAPIAVPVLSPADTVAYGRRTGLLPKPQETGHTTPLPQHFSDRLGWENLARVASGVYLSLPEAERARCVAFGQNYGHAGALEYWADVHPLPPAYAGHNSYWSWGPPPADTEVMLIVSGDPDDHRRAFREVTEAAVAVSPDALESTMRIWLCRDPLRPMAELWRDVKHFE